MPEEIEPQDFGEIAHWIAAPMKNVGTFEQFHEVVERAEKALREAHSAPRDPPPKTSYVR